LLVEGAEVSPETAGFSVPVDAQPAAAINDAAMMTKVRRKDCKCAEDLPITAVTTPPCAPEILGSRPQG
jgi:hypothetical protein